MMTPIAFLHDLAKTEIPFERIRATYGGKAAGLVRMIAMGYSDEVPQGFVVPCERCQEFLEPGHVDSELNRQIGAAVADLQSRTNTVLGLPDRPLILSIRSGAPESMPGLMTTILNLGCTGEVLPALYDQDPQFATQLLHQFLLGLTSVLPLAEDEAGEPTAYDVDPREVDVIELANSFNRRLLEEVNLADHSSLLFRCIEGVFRSWNSPRAVAIRDREPRLNELPGTAVLVQQMRFGNKPAGSDRISGSGVLFSRDPATGAKETAVSFLQGGQGELVVSGRNKGIDAPTLKVREPALYDQLTVIANKLELEWRDAVDVEFTVEDGELFLLQCRRAILSGSGALRAVLEMLDETTPDIRPQLSLAEAITMLRPDHFERAMYRRLNPAPSDELLAEGERGAPGAVVGRVTFSPAELLALKNLPGEEPRILVTEATSPDDIPAMAKAAGYLTQVGGALAHAALMARKLGKPAVVGVSALRIDRMNNLCEFTTPAGKKVQLRGGATISLDGSDGRVYRDAVEIDANTAENDIGDITLRLKTHYQSTNMTNPMSVFVNADTDAEILRGIAFQADGIGLIRTEGMRRVRERLESLRLSIRRTDRLSPAEIAELEKAHRQDFLDILQASRGLPISVRLLDDTELMSSEATRSAPPHPIAYTITDLARGSIGGSRRQLEGNAGLFHRARGVRIALVHEEIYALQVRALLNALIDTSDQAPQVELIVPMVIDPVEVERVQSIVAKEVSVWRNSVRSAWASTWPGPPLSVMIETPRAIEIAGEIASKVDRISIGTNDLTQMVFGFDRDDVGGHVMSSYFNVVLRDNPFSVLDRAVRSMIRRAVAEARDMKPALRVSVSGEHASDTTAFDLFRAISVDVLSCSPDRVPVAWLMLAKSVEGEYSRRNDADNRAESHGSGST